MGREGEEMETERGAGRQIRRLDRAIKGEKHVCLTGKAK